MDAAPERCDVVVIGAGLAGLTAAVQLAEKGFKVVVLEARDRVGGRTHSVNENGRWLDFGGMWLGPSQKRMHSLIQKFGLKTYKTLDTGLNIQDIGGIRKTYRGTIPPVHILALLDLHFLLRRMNADAQQLQPAAAPWQSDAGGQLDRLTMHTYIAQHAWTRLASDSVAIAIRMVLGCEPADVSALYFLHYVQQAGGVEALIQTTAGAQETRVEGGTQQVSEALTRALEQHGSRVVCRAAVTELQQQQQRGRSPVVVARAGTRMVEARAAVVAVPPATATRIRFDPPLPVARDQLSQRLPMGCVIKVLVAYSEAWWRAAGFSGQVVTDCGPVVATYDDCTPDGRHFGLVAFINGREALRWSPQPPAARRTAVLDQLAALFGNKAALQPTAYHETDWTQEEYSRGCYVGYAPPGVLTGYGLRSLANNFNAELLLSLAESLREPYGAIHWAGTETATSWLGYMEGAVESGERVACEIISFLRSAKL